MRFITQLLSIILFVSSSLAAPIDAEVIAGSCSINYGQSRVEVKQHTDRSVIDWRSFDIAPGEHVKFNLPNPSSVSLNRINGSKASEINGLLSSNGNLILLNPNGILFGKDAVIDATGVIASSSKVNVDEFMKGGAFGFSADGAGKIINKGKISSQDHGLVGLVSPHLENHGVISAKLGKVQIASSDSYTVDLAGDGLINLAISDHQKQKIENNGKINAYKGSILLTASAAREIIDSLIINNGKIEAKTGSIKLYAEGANAVPGNITANKNIKAGQSTIINNGIIDASGKKTGQKGGTIEVLADDIALLDNSKIDASGNLGGLNTYQNIDKSGARLTAAGGDIKIGGNYLGSGTTPAAKNMYVAKNAKIYADSIDNGDAGRVIIWADKQNDFYGNVFARGGKSGGDGGFVETSGKEKLNAKGYVTTLAAKGKRGTYLLDPTSISIYGSTTGNWPAFKSTDGSIDLSSGYILWFDGSDRSKIDLTYSQANIGAITANGTSGTTTLTTSSNISSYLLPGSRIRLGAAGSVTKALTQGADTYTVASVSGTTVTTVESLTSTYTTSNLYRGLVSTWYDKSGNSKDVAQGTTSRQPLWVSNQQNGLDSIYFSGGQSLSRSGGFPTNADYAIFANVNHTSTSLPGNIFSDTGTSHALYFRSTLYLQYQQGGVDFAASSIPLPLNTPGIFLAAFTQSNKTGLIYQNSKQTGSGTTPSSNGSSNIAIGSFNNTSYYIGTTSEFMLYSIIPSTNARNILEQYNSAKWAVALNPLNNGHSEVVQATTDGAYSAFTTRYLERLAASADISLTAGSGGILLDLKGDTLTLPSEVNLSLTTTSNGNITSNSSGTISATRTSSKGNITLTAGGSGAIDLNTSGALALTSSGGDISLSAGGNIKLYNLSGKTVTVDNHSTATDDVYLNGTVTSTASSGNSIIVASGRNFINNVGTSVFTTSGTARYLVYSSDPANNTPSTTPTGVDKKYGTTYPTAPGSTNMYLYTIVPQLSATANNQPMTYGSAVPSLTVSLTGDIDGDDVTSLYTGSPSTTATSGSSVGTYSITMPGSFALSTAATNLGYDATVNYTNGTLTISEAPLTIASKAGSSTYGVAPSLTSMFTYTGFQNSDTYSVLSGLALSTTIDGTTNAGSYSFHPTAATASNYNITLDSTDSSWTVNKAALTIASKAGSSTYGSAPSITSLYNFTGFQNSDTSSVISGLTSSPNIDGTTNVGSYSFHPTAATASNYNITLDSTDSSWTVNKAALTIASKAGSSTYGSAPSLTSLYNFTGFQNSDTSSVISGLTSSPTIDGTTNAGTHSFHPTAATASNYDIIIDSTDHSWTVNKAALTIASQAGSSTYGTAPALSSMFSYTGFVNGDSSAVISGLASSAIISNTTHVGSYSFHPIAASASNYNITLDPTNRSWAVNKANLTIAAYNGSSPYGAPPTLAQMFTYTSFYNGDSYNLLNLDNLSTSVLIGLGNAAGVYTYRPIGTVPSIANYNVIINYTPANWLVSSPVTAGSIDNTIHNVINPVIYVVSDQTPSADPVLNRNSWYYSTNQPTRLCWGYYKDTCSAN